MLNAKIVNSIVLFFLIAITMIAGTSSELELAKNGKATVEILLPAAPTPQEKVAAAELEKWLKEMTGAEFTVTDKSGGQPFISVGRTAEFKQQCPREAARDLKKEGYGIAVRNGNLFLYGGTQRGPLYAVIALLEEDLGCRWYTPDCTVIPSKKELKFTPRQRWEIPQFDNREAYFFTAVNKDWALHNRSNPRWFKLPQEWGGSITAPANYWNVHTFFRLIPNSNIKTHPEFFPMINGKRQPIKCMSSQPCLSAPGLSDYLAKKINALLGHHPEANMISISQNDNDGWCNCPRCQAELKQGYNRTDQMIRLVNKTAAKIWKKHPDVMISTLAYMGTFAAPNKIKPDPKLRIQLCTDKHAFRWPHLTVDQTDIFFPALKAWHQVGNPIDIWDYTVDFFDYLKPRANMEVTAKNLKIYRDYGVRGVMLQGSYSSPGGDDDPIKSWVWTKLMWNPNLDWKTLQRDFVNGYFKAAAKPIQKYYNLLEATRENWLKQPNRGDDLTFDNKFITQAEKYFAAAEKAVADNPVILNRVQVAELPVIRLRLNLAAKSPVTLPKAEQKKYRVLLNKFEAIAKKNHMVKIAEQGRAAKLKTAIEDLKINLFGKKAKVNANTVAFCEESDTTLWVKAKSVPDPLAGNGYAVTQPTQNTAWATQWRHIPWDKFERDKKYDLWVKMRFITTPNVKGDAFKCGVYNTTRKEHLRRIFKVKDLKPGYAWYNVGPFVPAADDIIFVAPCNNPGIKEMYCDRMEIRKQP